jgi:CheY-like chemotaxis protein
MDGLRVLIVDEHIEGAENLRKLLSGWGCGVEVCYSGTEAAIRAREERPHVALISLNLPDVRGADVAHQLRCCKQSCGLLLISLSTEEQSLERERATALGFDSHLIEPVDADEFRRALAQMAREEHLSPGA